MLITIWLIFLLIIITAFHLYLKKITGKTVDGGTKDVEVMVPLKYLRYFWQTLEMLLTNFEFNLIFISFYYSQFNIRNI